MADPISVRPYDLGAKEYDAHVSNPNDSIYHSYYEKPAIRSLAGNLSGKRVLSVGCGSGVDTQWLVENGAKNATGIDLSSGLIELGIKKFPNLDLRVMDMEALEFEDASFDLLISSLAIHYLADWTTALKEAKRVLVDGGRYIFSCGHPIDSAMQYFRDTRYSGSMLGVRKDLESNLNEYTGNYLQASQGGTTPLTVPIRELTVTVYTQTFAKMVKYITDAGFTIKSVVEPLPIDEMKALDLATYEKLMRFPSFIIWEIRK